MAPQFYTPLTRSKNYRDRDRDPEDVPVYMGHSLFNTTEGITLFFNVQSLLHCYIVINPKPCRVGSVGSVSASRMVGREFASRPGHTKDHHKNGTNCLPA